MWYIVKRFYRLALEYAGLDENTAREIDAVDLPKVKIHIGNLVSREPWTVPSCGCVIYNWAILPASIRNTGLDNNCAER